MYSSRAPVLRSGGTICKLFSGSPRPCLYQSLTCKAGKMASCWTAWAYAIIAMLTSLVRNTVFRTSNKPAKNSCKAPSSALTPVSGRAGPLVRQVEWLVSAGFSVIDTLASTAQAAGRFAKTIQVGRCSLGHPGCGTQHSASDRDRGSSDTLYHTPSKACRVGLTLV